MSFSVLMFILVLGLVLFGPEELPGIARTLGKIFYDIRRATNEVQQDILKAVMEHPAVNQVEKPAAPQEEHPVRQEEN